MEVVLLPGVGLVPKQLLLMSSWGCVLYRSSKMSSWFSRSIWMDLLHLGVGLVLLCVWGISLAVPLVFHLLVLVLQW